MNLLFATGLILLGFIMIVAEVFIPSLGALSLLSVVSMGGGVFFAFNESTQWGIWFLFGALFGGIGAGFLAFKVFPKTPIGKKMIVAGPTFGDDPAATDPRQRGLEGKRGIAVSYLRPAGIVEIEGRRVDCVAEGELLDAGTRVVVIRIEGNQVFVRPEGLEQRKLS